MKQVWRLGAAPIAVVSAFVFVFVLVIAAGGAMAGGSTPGTPGERVGVPWTGAQGNQRTTSAIMAQQRAVGSRPAQRLRRLRADLHLQPNPDSPATTPDAKVGAALAAGPKLSVGTSFTGATFNESGFVPPDSMGAVGPSQFLVAVNGRIKVLSKTGTVGPLNVDLDTFFSSVLSLGNLGTTDPRVRYDPLSGRWFVTAIDVTSTLTNNRVLLAVSDTATITGATGWTFFQFEHDTVGTGGDHNDFADFPTLGIDANALYIGANIFDAGGSFVNSSVYVVRKSSVTGGGPIVVTPFRDILNMPNGDGPYTPQGVDNLDPAATEGYFVGADGDFYGKLDVVRVGTPGGTPTLSASLPITVPLTSDPLNPTVLGSSTPLDGIDIRFTSASIVGGKLYTAHNIGVNSSGTTTSPTRDGVRWYELANLTSTPSLSRSGTIFDSSGSAISDWMPSLAVSPQGHAVIGMSTGSAATHPDGAVSSMLKGSSSFSAPVRYTASSQSYNPSFDPGPSTYRWGDYSHTSVDPCDGQTFWTIQEFVNGTDDWGVRVGKIAAPPPATPASTSPAAVATGLASTSVTLTGTSTAGSGFWDPGFGSCRIAGSIDGGVIVNSVTFSDETHVTLNISTVGATAGTRTVTITNPDGQTASAAVLVLGTPPSNTGLPTITGTATVGSMLTASGGTWNGSPAPTFMYQWERCDSDGVHCAAIGGETGSTYLIASADRGYRLRVTVTASNTSGSASADSATADVTGAPTNLAPPSITGTAQVGSVLTAQHGSWTGVPSPTFAYQWQRCDSVGANCTDIGGATGSTYTPVAADVGLTVLAKVSATNTGGTAGPFASAISPVIFAASSGGGGGGGGGGGATDVAISFGASPVSPHVGDLLTYTVSASSVAGVASNVVAVVNLPAGVTFVSASANRGPGCTGTTTVTCNLDFLSGSLIATVNIATTVTATGSLVATASLTTTPGDANTANNSASVTTVVASPPPPPPPPSPPPPLPAPVLKLLGTRTLLAAVRQVTTESVAARFSANERLRLSMNVTRLRSTTKLPILKGSRLAGIVAGSGRTTFAAAVPQAGKYALNTILTRKKLVKGATYVLHLTATNANGKKTALAIRFRA